MKCVSTDEWRVLGDSDWSEGALAEGTVLTAAHPGLETYATDWERLSSYTVKAGWQLQHQRMDQRLHQPRVI